MLAVFCWRLSLGLMGSLFLLSPAQVNPRFFRTHFLTTLGLTLAAAAFVHEQAGLVLWLALIGTLICSFLGSLVWMLEGAPAGRTLILLSMPALATALVMTDQATKTTTGPGWLAVDHLASSALLGVACTAMLMGHSYLIAPGMSLTPLRRLLAALAICLLARMALAGVGLGLWTAQHPTRNLETEMLLWLPVRWGLGFVAPLTLTWMAWETAKIRSTQSATGILYVVVILCFLAELTSQLLLEKTGYIL